MIDREVRKYSPNFIEFADKSDESYSFQFVLEDGPGEYWEMFLKLQDENFSNYFGKTINQYCYRVNGLAYKGIKYDNVGIVYYVYEGKIIGGIIDITEGPEPLYLSLDLNKVETM